MSAPGRVDRNPVSTPRRDDVRLDAILGGIDAHVACYDRDWRFTYLNDAAAAVLGRPKDELHGRCIWDVFPDAVGNQYYRELHEAAATGRAIRSDHYYAAWGKWFENHIYPAADGVTVYSTDVTRRKEAEEALRRSEERFRTLAVASSQCVWQRVPGREADDERAGVRWWAEFTGQPTDESRGWGWVAAVHPDDREYARAAWEAALAAGTDYEIEYRVRRRDGGYRWLAARGVPVKDADGAVREWVGTLTDVTDRKAAEAALRDRERMLAQAEAVAHVGGWEVDLTGGDPALAPPRWTDETYRIFGYEPGAVEASGELYLRHVHPDDRAAVAAAAPAALRDGTDFEIEHRFVRADGTVRVVQQRGTVVRDAAGRPARMVGTCQDVTDRRRAEEAARAARSQLQYITDIMPAFVARCDRDRRFIWVNRAYAARFGLTPEEVAGRPIADVIGHDAYEAIRPSIERILAGESVDAEVEVPYAGIGRRWMHAIYAPTLDPAGVPDGWVAVVTDVTRRKELELALVEADRKKDEFLATLAHELRNPLAPVRSAVAVLAGGPLPDPRQAWARDVIDRQTRLLTRLVDDLLDISRITRGTVELRRERVDLAAVVERAVETARPVLDAAGHAFELALPPDPVPLDADPTRLAQVLANLLTNAAKYTPPGGRVSLTAEAVGGEAVVRVRDTGVGIPAGKLTAVFEMFAQLDASLGRAQGGLGIGLTIARRMVELHGGTIAAHSDGPGRGSEFVVKLPLTRNSELGTRISEQTETGTGSSFRVPSSGFRVPLRVLVADDNRDAADSLGMLMRIAGHDVRVVHDGPAAVAAAREFRPRVLLLDIGMPGMSGYEVARRVRAAGLTDAVLIAVTGWGQEDDRRQSREAGFDHHLTKTADPEVLAKLLAAAAAQ